MTKGVRGRFVDKS